ncbi:hypothetical protein [Spirosoma pulveris]
MADYLVEVWDPTKSYWFPIIDFEAGLPFGKIRVDESEVLTRAQAQARMEDLRERYPGLKFRLHEVLS